MIRTSTQLKAKIRNLSAGDSRKAQTLIRNYIMERFLERVALSRYRNNFILKGGMLVAAVVGLETRATMDIDTTVKSLKLDMENATEIIKEIIATEVADGVNFRITRVTDIMEEHDYPGIRFMLEASLDNLCQAIKIDISTGDIITPSAVEFSYHLMFEDRSISLLTYNLETLLAEKMETIMSRGLANTRMRDFYDIHVISSQRFFDQEVLKNAFYATSEKRETVGQISDFIDILSSIESDEVMKSQWENFKNDSFFVGELSWPEVMESVKDLAEIIIQ